MYIEKLPAHEILMNQLPHWFKPVLDYIALMEVYGIVLDGIELDMETISRNFFIQTADADTLAIWERAFGLTVKYGDTIEYRRARILQKFLQTVPYTYWHLRDQLTALYGDEYSLSVDPEECSISIQVTSDRYGAIDLLYDLIWDVVPAHLKILANQETTSTAESEQYIGAFLSGVFVQTIAPGGN